MFAEIAGAPVAVFSATYLTLSMPPWNSSIAFSILTLFIKSLIVICLSLLQQLVGTLHSNPQQPGRVGIPDHPFLWRFRRNHLERLSTLFKCPPALLLPGQFRRRNHSDEGGLSWGRRDWSVLPGIGRPCSCLMSGYPEFYHDPSVAGLRLQMFPLVRILVVWQIIR